MNNISNMVKLKQQKDIIEELRRIVEEQKKEIAKLKKVKKPKKSKKDVSKNK